MGDIISFERPFKKRVKRFYKKKIKQNKLIVMGFWIVFFNLLNVILNLPFLRNNLIGTLFTENAYGVMICVIVVLECLFMACRGYKLYGAFNDTTHRETLKQKTLK